MQALRGGGWEARPKPPHLSRPTIYFCGSVSNVSLHRRQQKYTTWPDTSERYRVPPTATSIPHIGSLASIAAADVWFVSVSSRATFSLPGRVVISARML